MGDAAERPAQHRFERPYLVRLQCKLREYLLPRGRVRADVQARRGEPVVVFIQVTQIDLFDAHSRAKAARYSATGSGAKCMLMICHSPPGLV